MTTMTTSDDPDVAVPPPPADEAAAARGGPARWWPEALVGVATAVLYSWSLSINGLGNSYYAAAVTSMTRSWSNFFYAALDPGGWVTVDKPPAALWLQALSARIFGVSSWSLLLPSVLCGVAVVVVLMATVRRAWGRTAGIVAGVALALTPMMLAVSRSNNPDVTLVLAVVVAAWATQRAIGDGRYRWMAVAGAACGVGFLAKLLAAGIVMPALFGAFLIVAPGPWRRRILGCVVGAVAFVAVSAVWVAAVDIQSVSSHPWIGGSKDGTAWDLVTGYNGIGRITGSGEAGPVGGGGPGGVGAPRPAGSTSSAGRPGSSACSRGDGRPGDVAVPRCHRVGHRRIDRGGPGSTPERATGLDHHVVGLDVVGVPGVLLRQRHLPQLLRVAAGASGRRAGRHRRATAP